MKTEEQETSFKDLMGIFLPKLWIVFLVSAICAGAVSLYSHFFKEDTYTSDSTIYVYYEMTGGSVNTGTISVAQTMVETYKSFIKSDRFLSAVSARLESKYGYNDITSNQLNSKISVTNKEGTGEFSIFVTSADPKLSHSIATAMVEVMPDEIAAAIPNSVSMVVWSYPEEATSPNSKEIVKNAIIVFLISAVLVLVAIWIFAILDTTIREKSKLETGVGIPVLSVIPRHNVTASDATKSTSKNGRGDAK